MMRESKWPLAALLVGVLIAGNASAQDSGTAFDDEGGTAFDAPEPGAPAPAEQGGDSGDSASNGAPQSGPSNVNVERFKDWAVRCGTVGEEQRERCEMFQTVTRNETDEVVMRMVIGFPPNADQPGAIFELPLGIMLPPGVRLTIDDGEAVRFPVQICVSQGCRADIPLRQDLLQQMRRGANGQITVQDPRGRQFDIPISLMGFTAALERISE